MSTTNVFDQARVDFFSRCSKEELRVFQTATRDDIGQIVTRMEELGRRGKMKDPTRLNTFLRAMEMYGTVIEVFTNASPLLPYIWGPMKILLQAASKKPESLDALTEAYKQIGKSLPVLDRYAGLFAEDAGMAEALKSLYLDILEFHKRAYIYIRSGSWKMLTISRARWKEDVKFIITSLEQTKSLIETQANLSEIELTHKLRLVQDHKAAEIEQRERVIAITAKISPASVDVDQEKYAKIWNKVPQSGDWLVEYKELEAWFGANNDMQGLRGKPGVTTLTNDLLWLKGDPGAGKTVLASQIIATCKNLVEGYVTFFYCKQGDHLRDSFGAVLRSLLAQLIRQNPETTSSVYEEISQSSEPVLESLELLKGLIETAFGSARSAWIIHDGLDECNRKERKQIITWTRSLAERRGYLRVLFVSQDEPDIRKLLSLVPSLYLNEIPQHQQAIRTYTSRKLIRLEEKFDLPREIKLEVEEKVPKYANGMFLFARLILNYLKNQKSVEEFKYELDPARFPTGLDELVERIYTTTIKTLPEKDAAEALRLSYINRNAIESVSKLERRRAKAIEKENLRLSRKVNESCDACNLFNSQDSHFRIPLIKLMFSSISCQVCHTLCKAIISLDQDWLALRHSSSILDIERSLGTLFFQVRMLEAVSGFRGDESESPWGFPLIMHLFTRDLLEDSWNTLSIHNPIASHSGSDECFNKISEWLNACDNEHSYCARAERLVQDDTRGSLTAARVIDLGNSSQIYARLVTVSISTSILRWTALSYCWGGDSSFITTVSNINERQEAMPWSLIPKTFQDAMKLTHHLGIRYIWIDALCIIQDSPTDWSAEATKMGGIYQNAQLVIAADVAISGSSGIFASRERYSIPIDVDSGGNEGS